MRVPTASGNTDSEHFGPRMQGPVIGLSRSDRDQSVYPFKEHVAYQGFGAGGSPKRTIRQLRLAGDPSVALDTGAVAQSPIGSVDFGHPPQPTARCFLPTRTGRTAKDL